MQWRILFTLFLLQNEIFSPTQAQTQEQSTTESLHEEETTLGVTIPELSTGDALSTDDVKTTTQTSTQNIAEGEVSTPLLRPPTDVLQPDPKVEGCFPQCQNGATCQEICTDSQVPKSELDSCEKMNICICPRGFEGQACETDTCLMHTLNIPTMNFVISNLNSHKATVNCKEGFKTGFIDQMDVECIDGEWDPSIQDILQSGFKCNPVCNGPALNDGICFAPNKFLCPFPYGGPSCEHRLDMECPDLTLDTIENGEIIETDDSDSSNGTITKAATRLLRCNEGYEHLPDRLKEKVVLCLDGKWSFEDGSPIDAISQEYLKCHPQCDPECQNEGKCTSPGECQCEGNFEGNYCEKKKCSGPKPEIEGATIDDDTNIVKCNSGFQLPNGYQESILVCSDDGAWILDELEGLPKLSCESVTECPGIPISIPNAVMKDVAPGVKESICNDGFIFPSGKRTSRVTCLNGKWEVAGNQTLNGGCIPSCFPECQNNGYCSQPNTCKCPPNTDGPLCEKKKCGTVPLLGSDKFQMISTDQVKLECRDGAAFPNREKSLILPCVDGQYLVPRPYTPEILLECHLTCEGKCQNDGTCSEEGKCICLPEFTGEFCEEKVTCKGQLPIIKNSATKIGSPTQYIFSCIPGHKIEGNKNAISVNCVDGNWTVEGYTVSNVSIDCQPYCEGSCSSHGTCKSPEICSCFPGFTGAKCESHMDAGCIDAPPKIENAIMKYNITDGYYTCMPGYAMPEGETEKTLSCKRGNWYIKDCACSDNPPNCDPLCDPLCLNGGICIAPNKCQCPENYSGDFCQMPKLKACLTAPPPVPNSVVELSDTGSSIICNTGYQFQTGSVRESVWCNNGEWAFVSNKKACYPVCSNPCLNKGVCIAPQKCQCVEPFTGPRCESVRSEQCWKEPPFIEFAVAHYNSQDAVITCIPGYAFQSSESNINLTCSDGDWSLYSAMKALPPLPACIPTCDPQCLNGGHCIAPSVCNCPKGFSGLTCDTIAPAPCLRPPRAIAFSTITFDSTSGHLVCDYGYRLSMGYSEMDISCHEGKWVASIDTSMEIKDFNCRPVCLKPCKNQGVCVGPDICKCPPSYTGKWCEFLRCMELPKDIKNAVVEYSNDTMFGVARCKSGYRLRWGSLGLKFNCTQGRWLYQTSENKMLDMECYPICRQPCVNGGQCIKPDVCHCPEGFYGPQCQKRYSKTITGKMCKLPFRYQDEWFYGCTGIGYHRPWCATSTNAQNLITSWSVCVADLGEKKVVVTYSGDACVFPFAYHGAHYTECIITNGREQPWCATEVNTYNQILNWGYCNNDWGSKMVILTVKGETCDLPFEWRGQHYVGCVEDVLRPWCVTSSSKGVATRHGYCMTDWGFHRVTLTSSGNLCIFPFVHQSRTYDSCFSETTNSQPRCATRVDGVGNALTLEDCIVYKEDTLSAQPFRLGKYFPRLGHHANEIITLMGLSCVLPFWYQNEEYTECTFTDSDKPWCATAVNDRGVMVENDFCPPNWDIPEVQRYDFSEDATPQKIVKEKINVNTIRGTNCSFPFKFNGLENYGCIEDGFQRPWCATKVDQNLNILESDHCPDNWELNICPEEDDTLPETYNYALSADTITTTDGDPCIFPFIYLGKTFTTCTDDDAVKVWCPTSLDAQGTPNTWGYCSKGWERYSKGQAEELTAFRQNETFAISICEYRRIARHISTKRSISDRLNHFSGQPNSISP